MSKITLNEGGEGKSLLLVTCRRVVNRICLIRTPLRGSVRVVERMKALCNREVLHKGFHSLRGFLEAFLSFSLFVMWLEDCRRGVRMCVRLGWARSVTLF